MTTTTTGGVLQDNSISLVYIVCRGHSGSTMLELLLNRNSHIASMGELDLLPLQIVRDEQTRWVGTCSCGERPGDCEVWGEIVNWIREHNYEQYLQNPFQWPIANTGLEEEYGWHRPMEMTRHIFNDVVREYSLRTRRPLPAFLRRRFRSWVARRDEIARCYAYAQNVKFVVDASKDPLQLLDIVRYSSLNVKVLYLTRDPRALVWSALKRGRASVDQECEDWCRVNERVLRILDLLDPSCWKQVSYEDLCGDLNGELESILSFLHVPFEMVSPEEEMEKRHTIAGNTTRFRPLENVREDDAWRKHLTGENLRSIRRQTLNVSRRLGYLLEDDL